MPQGAGSDRKVSCQHLLHDGCVIESQSIHSVYNGNLNIAYTQGKEDCVLSIVPIEVLAI
jgi:hypothetical protein